MVEREQEKAELKRPRMIISDIDRTLLTHDHILLPVVKTAVRRATDAGVSIVLASARSPQGVRLVQAELGLSGPAICFNGAWTGMPATPEVWDSRPLSQATAATVAARAIAAGLVPMWFTERTVRALKQHADVARRQAAVTHDALELCASPSDFGEAPHKVMIVVPPDKMTCATRLLEEGGEGAKAVRSGPGLIEVVQAGISKARAAADLAVRYGLKSDEVAAAGDNDNDVELLAWARLAVSVSNGTAEARRAANFTGGSCDEGGIAIAFDWLLSLPAASSQLGGIPAPLTSSLMTHSQPKPKKEKRL